MAARRLERSFDLRRATVLAVERRRSTISIDRDGTGGDYGCLDFAVLQGVTSLNLTTLLSNGNIGWTP